MLNENTSPPFINSRCATPVDDCVPEFYQNHYCSSNSVTESLRDEVTCWTPTNPILIDAPPGKGKTNLIYEELIPTALRGGKNVLILSNRVALSIQQKRKIMEILGSPMADWLSDEGVRNWEDFGKVRVITYHKLPTFTANPENAAWIQDLLYIVADEVHFFTADSLFVPKCSLYLKLLTQKFQHAVRVYMTATSWDVLYPLAEAEQKNWRGYRKVLGGWEPPRKFVRYVFPADYRYIDLNFFTHLDEIRDMILKDSAMKWIVFVDNKREGKALAAELGERALYIDADGKGSESYHALLKSSRFDTQVLVATKLLDCGINVLDSQVRSIAVVSDDRTSLIQMLGRKRCAPTERVNLYVGEISKQKLGKRQEDMQKLETWHRRYNRADSKERSRMAKEMWQSDDAQLRLFFNLADGRLIPNYLAFYMLERKLRFYKDLKDKKYTFQDAVKKWLGKDDNLESTNPTENLTRFCEEYEGVELSEEEISRLRKWIFAAYAQQGMTEPQKKRIPCLKQEALNNRLKSMNLPYSLQQRAWIIERNRGDDCSEYLEAKILCGVCQ